MTPDSLVPAGQISAHARLKPRATPTNLNGLEKSINNALQTRQRMFALVLPVNMWRTPLSAQMRSNRTRPGAGAKAGREDLGVVGHYGVRYAVLG